MAGWSAPFTCSRSQSAPTSSSRPLRRCYSCCTRPTSRSSPGFRAAKTSSPPVSPRSRWRATSGTGETKHREGNRSLAGRAQLVTITRGSECPKERTASRPRLAAAANTQGRSNLIHTAPAVGRAASRGRLAVQWCGQNAHMGGGWYAASVLSFLLASGGKQSVLLLPAVMLVWDILVEKTPELADAGR